MEQSTLQPGTLLRGGASELNTKWRRARRIFVTFQEPDTSWNNAICC